MKNIHVPVLLLVLIFSGKINAQVTSNSNAYNSTELPHSSLPNDGVIQYLPKDNDFFKPDSSTSTSKVQFKPLVNFYFRPEGTINYKEGGMPEDTGHLNFYLRGDFGGRFSLPKNIDMVVNLQSYGVYTRSFGPLDKNITLYEAYVDMKKLDRNGRLSLRFGRMDIGGQTGTEIIIGNAAFGAGRSFESVKLRYKTNHSTSDVMWVQMYQEAPDSAGADWNHPIFLASLNTFRFSETINLDANLPYIIDQFNSGYRTQVFMPDIRLFGRVNSIQYSAELIFQYGTAHGIVTEDARGEVNANAVELSAGYFKGNHKFCIDFAYYRASGDHNPEDNLLKSYNVLWQNEHRRFGYIDAFKGSNVQAGTLHVDWMIGRLVGTGIHGVFANVLEPLDRATGIATIPSLGSITTTSTSIGYGGDWYLNYFYNHFLTMQLSASVFSPGEYFTAVNGIDKTMVRLYLMLALKIL